MGFCQKMNTGCEYADSNGYCNMTSCVKQVNSVHTGINPIELADGVYIQLFAVKNGIRYDFKITSMKDMSTILTNSLMDGIEKLAK